MALCVGLQVRAAAEGLLKAGLRLDLGLEIGQTAAAAAGGTTKSFLTDAYLRRLASRQMDDWEEVEELLGQLLLLFELQKRLLF